MTAENKYKQDDKRKKNNILSTDTKEFNFWREKIYKELFEKANEKKDISMS